MTKSKLQLSGDIDYSTLYEQCRAAFPEAEFDRQDGIKMIFGNEWVHLRKSNTEPVLRIYAESTTAVQAEELVSRMKAILG